MDKVQHRPADIPYSEVDDPSQAEASNRLERHSFLDPFKDRRAVESGVHELMIWSPYCGEAMYMTVYISAPGRILMS